MLFFNKKKEKLGLALGGGGARGFAHLGVYKYFEEQNIKLDFISGTSAGAIIGAFLADGKSAEETFKILTRKNLYEYSKFQFFKSGFIRLEGLKEDLKTKLSVKNIEELAIPLIVCTTNMNTGEAEYINKGLIYKNVLASASIPMLFTPMIINNQIYVDGGMFDNIPVQPLLEKCDKTIAVNITPLKKVEKIDGFVDIAVRTFQLSIQDNTQRSRELCDILIEPKKLADYHILEVGKAQEMFDIGYDCAKETDFSSILN